MKSRTVAEKQDVKVCHAGLVFYDRALRKNRMTSRCSKNGKAINLRRATWTVRPDLVTCPRCKAILARQRA